MTIAHQLREFVTTNFLFGDNDVSFKNDDSFIEKGIIDSTGVLELVSFLEEKYNFKVNDEEIIPDNLDSIVKLTSFVEKKLNGCKNVSQ